MTRSAVLAVEVAPLEERLRRIEAEPLPASVGALIAEAAAATPDRIVWNFFEGGGELTYAELEARVNGLAAGLLGVGIGFGTHVAVMLPNIPAMPLTWLALARLGAVMIPVNVAYRDREVAYVVGDSDSEFIVAHADSLNVLAAARTSCGLTVPPSRTIVVGGPRPADTIAWDDLATPANRAFAPPREPGHDDLLNIQYTSGTTGFPKGCMLTQRYWLSAGKVNAFRDGRVYARILASAPFHYMDPQWLLMMTLFQRATLFVAARPSLTRFTAWLGDHRINFCLLPWVLHKTVPDARDARNEVIRANIYGAPKQIHGAIEDRFDLCAREAFGMTEIGPALFMPIEATDMVGSGSCGRPVPFRQCRVANDKGETLPPGAVGELLVTGPGIMRGYYRKPEATAAAFHGAWFRTGDLFRMDERGYFTIVGRLKDMIRRSGENVAASEVEAVLHSSPDVEEAAVVPVPDPLRDEEIKAVIVLRPGAVADGRTLDRLIALCESQLAPFKVPRYFAFRPSFPRTASQKIAKHVLVAEAKGAEGSFDRVTGRWIEESASGLD